MDCSLPGSSIRGIFQARVLEWVAIAFSREMCIISLQRYVHYLTSKTALRGSTIIIPIDVAMVENSMELP